MPSPWSHLALLGCPTWCDRRGQGCHPELPGGLDCGGQRGNKRGFSWEAVVQRKSAVNLQCGSSLGSRDVLPAGMGVPEE